MHQPFGFLQDCRLAALLACLRRLAVVATACSAGAMMSVVAVRADVPTPDQAQGIPLYKTSNGSPQSEQWDVGNKDGRGVRNVTFPTLTPVLPDPAKATGVAVIVAPGGAFYMLGLDAEGFTPARWLADHGIAAFVLKYRTDATPRDLPGYSAALNTRLRSAIGATTTPGERLETPAAALEDAQAAVRLIRGRAAEWHINPNRVGFLGFSAGAMTTLSVGLAEDKTSRPDFIAPIYPPMYARDVPADAPPMFVAIALDDVLFAQGKNLELISSWRNAKRPIEAHLYERGGHGFAMADKSAASSLWIEQFYAWLKDRGLFKPAP